MNEEECLFLALWYRATECMAFASLRSCLLPTFLLPCNALFFVVHYNHKTGFCFLCSLAASPSFISLYVTRQRWLSLHCDPIDS